VRLTVTAFKLFSVFVLFNATCKCSAVRTWTLDTLWNVDCIAG